jgi:hypothetical protein
MTMEQNKNKYPGFLDGLKASNIALNKTSLDEYSEQILNRIAIFKNTNNVPEFIKDNLERGKIAIQISLDHESTPENIIHSYIKFGDIFKSVIPELKQYCDIIDIKDVAINYLQIAKYSTDSRIKDISIAIAKELE